MFCHFQQLHMVNRDVHASPLKMIGCCGAFCSTCRPYITHVCKGCKPGYDDGTRDIAAARCAMKLCCLTKKNVETCADCPDYSNCLIIHEFFNKKGYKYKKYRQSLEFIRIMGYPAFLRTTGSWTCAYGRLDSPE